MALRLTDVAVLTSLLTLGACLGETVSLGPPRDREPPPSGTGEPPASVLPTLLPGESTVAIGRPGWGNGPTLCKPGSTQSCYDGPLGSEAVGACSAGVAICTAKGTAYGACNGQVRPSVEVCGSSADENCDGVKGCTGQFLWSERFGDGELQDSHGVAVDFSGNVLVVGSFDGVFDLGSTHVASMGADVFLTKVDRKGTALWSKRFGDAADQTPAGVAVDTHDNVVVTGSFTGSLEFGGATLTSALGRDVFLAKLGPDGEHRWSKRFGGPLDQECRAVATDRADDIAITGTLYGTIDFGGALLLDKGHDVFVAKLGPNGEHLWSKSFGDTHLQDGYGVALDGQGNVIVTGRYAGAIDFGGGPLTLGAGGATRLFVAKLDAADGHHLWSKSFGDGTGPAVGHAVAVDSADDVVVTGSFGGAIDFGGGALVSAGDRDLFIAKLDGSDGAHRWSSRYGDGAEQHGLAVAVDRADAVIVTGTFYGAIDFGEGPLASLGGSNGFLLKLDPLGKPVWSKRFGEHKSARSTAVAVAQTGEVVVSGSFDGDADFGGGNLMSAGKSDGFLAQYRP